MLNKESKDKLIKITPEEFISFLEKRGYSYDYEMKKKIYDLENKYKQIIKKKEIIQERKELCKEYNIPENISELIDLFQILDNYNINYINYVLIYDNMNIQQFKNFYRYLMIKWNKVKNNLNNVYNNDEFMNKINNFFFQDTIEEINNQQNYETVKKLVTDKIKKFIFINNNTFPNIYILFFINTLQEYLYPIQWT